MAVALAALFSLSDSLLNILFFYKYVLYIVVLSNKYVPSFLPSFLQRMHNAAASFILCPRIDRATPLLRKLHWLGQDSVQYFTHQLQDNSSPCSILHVKRLVAFAPLAAMLMSCQERVARREMRHSLCCAQLYVGTYRYYILIYFMLF